MDDPISRKDLLKQLGISARFNAGIPAWVIGVIKGMPSAEPEITNCKDCKNSEHWYRDKRLCFLWSETGVSVFDDGFCNYAERREKDNE